LRVHSALSAWLVVPGKADKSASAGFTSHPTTGKVSLVSGAVNLCATVDVNHLQKIGLQRSRRLTRRADTVGVKRRQSRALGCRSASG
jgi:hypothetical protein